MHKITGGHTEVITRYIADHPCNACGYWPNLKRAKANMTEVEFRTDTPWTVITKCRMCGNVKTFRSAPP
jgi:hypothetical protein